MSIMIMNLIPITINHTAQSFSYPGCLCLEPYVVQAIGRSTVLRRKAAAFSPVFAADVSMLVLRPITSARVLKCRFEESFLPITRNTTILTRSVTLH